MPTRAQTTSLLNTAPRADRALTLRSVRTLAGAAVLDSRWPKTAVHAIYAASLLRSWHRFRVGLKNPERVGQLKLKGILRRNEMTEFGTSHRFERIDSIAEFQSRVPVRSYDELEPLIARTLQGRSQVLTTEDVIAFERTGGSPIGSKLIPYTASLFAEFDFATSAWLGNIYRRYPDLIGKRTYYAVSPRIQFEDGVTPGGIPIGIPSEIDYLNPLAKLALRQLAVVPNLRRWERTALTDRQTSAEALRDWRIKTAAALMSYADIGLISVWSPTFLLPVLQAISQEWDEVEAQIPRAKRRAELRTWHNEWASRHARDESLQSFLNKAWPDLRLLSCWADGSSTEAALKLELNLPDQASLEGKGLVATEGVITIPFDGAPDPVAAIGCHFLEFIDLEHPNARPRMPHELKIGALYSPVITTSGGLYRYQIRDVLYCTGRNRNSPTLRFRGRLDRASDLRGEQLNSAHVERAFEIACSSAGFRPEFFLLAPCAERLTRYRAYIESTRPTHDVIGKFMTAFERAIRHNRHYAAASDNERLEPIKTVLVKNASEIWERVMLDRGHRLGSIKLSRLDSDPRWADFFQHQTPSAPSAKPVVKTP